MEKILTRKKNTFICKDCIKSLFMKKLFKEKFLVLAKSKCAICKRNKNCISLMNDQSQNILRALVRYYYNEEKYNPHLGGTDLHRIFTKKNKIFANKLSYNIAKAIAEIISKKAMFLKNKTEGVSLYYGHNNAGLRWAFRAVENDFSADELRKLEYATSNVNYFIFKDQYEWILNYLKFAELILRKREILYRGRIGGDTIEKREPYKHWRIVPLGKEKMLPPLPYQAVAGRANRAGIAYLYLTNNIETAIAECRPHVGHDVTIGYFQLKQNIKIIDFSKLNFCYFSKSDESIKRFIFLRDIARLFSLPFTPENREINYLTTQFISDILREAKYDGITFSSSIGNGIIYVLFNKEHCRYLKSELFSVSKIKYSYEYLKYNQK